jgi:hypothetical protein
MQRRNRNSVDFTQLGMNVHRRSVFAHKNESQSVIRTWQEKRVGAPTLTAAKPRLSVADSSPGWGLGVAGVTDEMAKYGYWSLMT